MKTVVPNIVITAMSVTYFLLAVQAEPVTRVLGFIFGSILAIAIMRQVFIQAKGGEE